MTQKRKKSSYGEDITRKTSLQFFAKRLLNCTPDENRTHIVGTGIRYSIH